MSAMKGQLLRELMQDADFRQLMIGDDAEADDEAEPRRLREGVRPRGDAFYEALQANPPPCNGCPFYARCRDERLACLEFATWADPMFLRGMPARARRAELSTPDAPYVWVHDELFPPMTPEAWAAETALLDKVVAHPSPLTSQLATATVERTT